MKQGQSSSQLEILREALASKGFRTSRSKTEYMHAKFSDNKSAQAKEVEDSKSSPETEKNRPHYQYSRTRQRRGNNQ